VYRYGILVDDPLLHIGFETVDIRLQLHTTHLILVVVSQTFSSRLDSKIEPFATFS
jgi:hypothetical protein